ncbi:hypothetical protein ACTVCO_08460 [Sanguibacter sp. A247]|uniref:hypothetical protein n=1 Tax=unclassified Sanguibacter TaxID=2645534 RepID=UPI003FD75D2E
MATASAARAEGGADRAVRALAALRAAEARTGARRVTLTEAPAAVAAPAAPAAERPAQAAPRSATPRPATADPAVPRPAAPSGVRTAERPPFSVPHELATVLPEGLRRGAVTQVTGSTALVLEMLAHIEMQRAALGDEPWIAVVGCPTLGLVAAAEAGVSLDRLLLVPEPGVDSAMVLAALIDGVDVVVVGDTGLSTTDRRLLIARARERGVALIATSPWPGARVVVRVAGVRWRGIGVGEGRLRSRELLVERLEAGETRRAHVALVLPAPGDGYDAPEPTPGMMPASGSAASGSAASGVEQPERDLRPLRLVGRVA